MFYRFGAMKWAYLSGEKLVIGVANGIISQAVESVYSQSKEAFTSMSSAKGNTGEYRTYSSRPRHLTVTSQSEIIYPFCLNIAI